MNGIGEAGEEVLELLIALEGQGLDGAISIEDERVKSQAASLVEAGYAVFRGDGKLELTPHGREEATLIIRRHRLAERLLVDVLDVGGKLVHDTACRFEHFLRADVEEKICTLLGHPKVCPHGKPIPPGTCCRRATTEVTRVVSPLSDLAAGEGGHIAYLHCTDSQKLNKLMAMGVLPGQPIQLTRRFPSYIFQVGNTQYAVDRGIAEAIYVRLSGGTQSEG